MKNVGKKFEDQFKASIPNDVYYLRLHDSSIGFDIANSTQRFALKSPYDCILYKYPYMHALELKSTSGTSISFEGKSPMIKENQINNLTFATGFLIRAGFIFNFRKHENTYYVPMDAFNVFINDTKKKSINEQDVKGIGILIPSKKLRVNYKYDLSILFPKSG